MKTPCSPEKLRYIVINGQNSTIDNANQIQRKKVYLMKVATSTEFKEALFFSCNH